MRKLFQCLFLLSAVVLAGSMWSCSDDDDQPGTNGEDSTLGVEAPASDAVFATSATFKLSTKGAESYVYKAVEGANAAEPDPVVVYAEAQESGTIVAVTGDTDEALVAGLEGNKTYTVFFIFKVGDEYKIYSQEINTPEYSQLVTIIKTDMSSMTLHVEVPDDVYYSLGFIDKEKYEAYKIQYGRTDIDYVVSSPYGGMKDPRYKGPQNITIANGVNAYTGAFNEKDYNDDVYPYEVHPGTGYVIFVAQCNEDGSSEGFVNYIDNGGGDDDDPILGSKLPNVKEYTEEKPVSENMEFTGFCAKTVLVTQEPNQGSGNVMIHVDRVTEKTAVVTLTPTDDVYRYVVNVSTSEEAETLIPLFGGEETWQAYILSSGRVFDGAQQLSIELSPGVSYRLSVVALYNEESTVQTFHEEDGIKAIVSDKPAVEFKVTPLALENPYQIGFNIKAPNADCAGFKYIINYTKEWYPVFKQLEESGMEGTKVEEKIATMMSSFGQPVNDPEILGKINSSEGCDLYFTSMDDIESWLILESYNSDEKTKLFYDGSDYRVKSAPLKPEEPVNSELFSKLQGTWNATITKPGEGNKPLTMPVTIAAGPEKIASLPEDVKTHLVTYYMDKKHYTKEAAEKLVLDYFAQYQERTAYYTQKYKNMNCLVGTGFSYSPVYAPFASPWDLFQSTSYSSYDTDEMFRDYGPKLFFQIGKDEEGKDKVTVISTMIDPTTGYYSRYIDPMSDWQYTLNLYAYDANLATSFYMADFPVELSDDMNTMTIKPVEQDGITYTPSIAIQYSQGGTLSWGYQVDGTGIVLTRAAENAAPANATRGISTAVIPEVAPNSGSHFRRTRSPFGYVPMEPVELEISSGSLTKKNLKK